MSQNKPTLGTKIYSSLKIIPITLTVLAAIPPINNLRNLGTIVTDDVAITTKWTGIYTRTKLVTSYSGDQSISIRRLDPNPFGSARRDIYLHKQQEDSTIYFAGLMLNNHTYILLKPGQQGTDSTTVNDLNALFTTELKRFKKEY